MSGGRDSFGWAVIGPGSIAHKFADAVQRLPGMHLQAVLGRRVEVAQAFARQWQAPQAPQVATSLAELMQLPGVDGVYIATPHTAHAAAAMTALDAGKPVLCEKPLTHNAADTEALLAHAQARGVFLMEALWTRCLPLYDGIAQWVEQGRIGTLRAVQSNFCFPMVFNPESRLFNPALAGGPLLDMGIYNVALSRWAAQHSLGQCPPLQSVQAEALQAASGVAMRLAATLRFEGGLTASMQCGYDAVSHNMLELNGSAGAIRVPRDFFGGTQAELLRPGEPVETLNAPFRINGFEYQIEEALRCVRAGLTESPRMPHAETLAVAQTLRRIEQAVRCA